MNKIQILTHDAQVALLSGLTTYKPGTKEIMWKYSSGHDITVEIIDAQKEIVIIREYYNSGRICYKHNYKNGELHGRQVGYYINGNIHWQEEHKNGVAHGKQVGRHANGDIYSEYYYENGIRVKQ